MKIQVNPDQIGVNYEFPVTDPRDPKQASLIMRRGKKVYLIISNQTAINQILPDVDWMAIKQRRELYRLIYDGISAFYEYGIFYGAFALDEHSDEQRLVVFLTKKAIETPIVEMREISFFSITLKAILPYIKEENLRPAMPPLSPEEPAFSGILVTQPTEEPPASNDENPENPNTEEEGTPLDTLSLSTRQRNAIAILVTWREKKPSTVEALLGLTCRELAGGAYIGYKTIADLLSALTERGFANIPTGEISARAHEILEGKYTITLREFLEASAETNQEEPNRTDEDDKLSRPNFDEEDPDENGSDLAQAITDYIYGDPRGVQRLIGGDDEDPDGDGYPFVTT